ncbi:MAG: hypothetical protein ACKVH8_23835 [Pirellulales bacterium]
MNHNNRKWIALLSLNLTVVAAAWVFQSSEAAPPNAPFANSVEQRNRMIQLLTESNQLLKEQNALLRSGKLQVQIAEKKK